MAQYARPNSTVSAGGWTAVGAATLHEATDEITPDNDTTYALADSTDTIMELGLSSVTSPGTGTVTFRITADANGSTAPERISVYLYNGSTWSYLFEADTVDLDRTYTTFTDTSLTVADFSAFNTLAVRVVVETLAGGEEIRVTQIEVEFPDEAAGGFQVAWARNSNQIIGA